MSRIGHKSKIWMPAEQPGIDQLREELKRERYNQRYRQVKETTAPAGYTLLASAVSFTIAQDGTKTGTEAIELTPTETVQAVKILNGSGTAMPSTGGIGTTIFYVVGSILVIGALVLLVVKRRMQEF